MSGLHPLPKMAVCLVWIGACIAVFDVTFQLATIALAAGLLVLVERKPVLLVLGLMVPFALFGFGFLTTSLLFRQESGYALQMAREQAVTSPDAMPGLVLFFRAIACGMVSAFFALTTDPGQLVRAAMVRLRLPASIGYALMQAMHLVPDLAREVQTIRLARAMRAGRRMRRIPSPYEMFSLLVPLLAFAIRRAGRAALAMEARGLGAQDERTQLHVQNLRRADAMFVVVAALVLAGLIVWAVGA